MGGEAGTRVGRPCRTGKPRRMGVLVGEGVELSEGGGLHGSQRPSSRGLGGSPPGPDLVCTPPSGSGDTGAPPSSFSRFCSRHRAQVTAGPASPPGAAGRRASRTATGRPLPAPRLAGRVCESSDRNQAAREPRLGGRSRGWWGAPGTGPRAGTAGFGGLWGWYFRGPYRGSGCGVQGRAGPWSPGLGHKNLVRVSTKRMQSWWRAPGKRDSRVGGGQGVGRTPGKGSQLPGKGWMETSRAGEGVQVPVRPRAWASGGCSWAWTRSGPGSAGAPLPVRTPGEGGGSRCPVGAACAGREGAPAGLRAGLSIGGHVGEGVGPASPSGQGSSPGRASGSRPPGAAWGPAGAGGVRRAGPVTW